MKMCINDGTRYAGPHGNAGPGGIVDVPEAEAKALEEGGFAVRVDAMPRFSRSVEIERAIEEPTEEKAVEIETMRTGKPRKRREK